LSNSPTGPDFLYIPSTDVAADLAFYLDAFGAGAGFAIEAFGARVAEVRLGSGSTRLILADHLEGEAPVALFRVGDLDEAAADLRRRGFEPEAEFEFPHGPALTLRSPGGQRIGLYQLVRPQMDERFAGRRDF
jgi:hypothetical protein